MQVVEQSESPSAISALAQDPQIKDPFATLYSLRGLNLIVTAGLVGAILGAAIGLWEIPYIAYHHMKFLAIVPVIGSIWGMVIGGYGAMFIAHLRKMHAPSTKFGIKQLPPQGVLALFEQHGGAGGAIEELANAGVAQDKIIVVGEDCDRFRDAIHTLYPRKFDCALITAGLIGAVMGAVAGYVGRPLLVHELAVPLTITCTLIGAMLGSVISMAITGILRVDLAPASPAAIHWGTVNGAAMAVAVATTQSAESERIRALLAANGAKQITCWPSP